MDFDHRVVQIPIHPGDPVYIVDRGNGWSIREETVVAVILTWDGLQAVSGSSGYEPQGITEPYFFKEDAAKGYVKDNRPNPPYEYWYDATCWMDAMRWQPYYSGQYFVRIRKGTNFFVIRALYKKDLGFYDEGRLLHDVEAWIGDFGGVEQAVQAGDYTGDW